MIGEHTDGILGRYLSNIILEMLSQAEKSLGWVFHTLFKIILKAKLSDFNHDMALISVYVHFFGEFAKQISDPAELFDNFTG